MESAAKGRTKLRREYELHYASRLAAMKTLENRVEEAVSHMISNVTVKGRVKSFESFHKKIIR
jgi:ppGpp synthetase/RelA/SpoT-type nucleotidyltranferase